MYCKFITVISLQFFLGSVFLRLVKQKNTFQKRYIKQKQKYKKTNKKIARKLNIIILKIKIL